MLANALTYQRKITHRRRRARRSSVFGNALGNAAVRGIQNYQAQKAKAKEYQSSGILSDLLDSEHPWFNEDGSSASAMGGVTTSPQMTMASGVLRGDQYANNPAYRYLASSGGYVEIARENKFVGQVDDWSGVFSKTYKEIPSIQSYMEAYPDADRFDVYSAYNREVAQPFTQFQKEFNSDPARVAAAWDSYHTQMAAFESRAAEHYGFSVEKYDAFVARQNESDFAYLYAADRAISHFKNAVLEQSAYEGAIASKSGSSLGYAYHAAESVVVGTLLPGSLAEAGLLIAGGPVAGKVIGGIARFAPKLPGIGKLLGADVGGWAAGKARSVAGFFRSPKGGIAPGEFGAVPNYAEMQWAYVPRGTGSLSGNAEAVAFDTIPAGQRVILRPIEIEFPAAGLTKAQQQRFGAHLAEQQTTLNRLSLTRPDDLKLNLLNYPHIKTQVAASRRLARGYLPESGRGLDAAHSLDTVAGGYAHEFAGFRDPIQQRIGALWRTRTDQIVPGREHWLVPKFD